MKKFIALVLCTMLVATTFALVGCNNKKTPNIENGKYYLTSKRLDGESMPGESYIQVVNRDTQDAKICNLLIYETESRGKQKDSVISAYNEKTFKYTKCDDDKSFVLKPASGVYYDGVWDGAKTLTLDEYYGSTQYVLS